MLQEGLPRHVWAVMGCTWLIAFAMLGRILCLPPLAHIIKETLFLTHGKIGLIFSLPLAILAATAILSGLLGDRIGPRIAAGIGAIIMTAGSFATGTATNFLSLFVFTCIFGIGFSMVYTSLPTLMALWFSKEKAGLATGVYVTGIGIGAAVSLGITLPVVFPITNSFRGTLFIWSIPVLVATILWWIVVKDPPASSSPIESRQIGERGKGSYVVWGNKSLWLVALCFFCLSFQFYTWVGWTPKLMMLKGATPELAAFMISWMQWISIPFMFLMPWAAHRIGLTKPFLWVSAVVAALLSFIAIYMPLPLGWFVMAILGITQGTLPLLLALPVELMPEESAATATGMVLSIGVSGSLAGPWLAGHILDATGTLDMALVVVTGAAIAMAIFAFLLPETGSQARPRPSYDASLKRSLETK